MVATFVENVQGHTSVLRDLENTHHQRLEEIAMVTLEKVVKNEMEDDIPDELRDVSVTSPHITSNSKTSHVMQMIVCAISAFRRQRYDSQCSDVITRCSHAEGKKIIQI